MKVAARAGYWIVLERYEALQEAQSYLKTKRPEIFPAALRCGTTTVYSSNGDKYRIAPISVPQLFDEFVYWPENHMAGRVATVRSGAVAL